MPKISTAITAACGEHYVASYLSGTGLIVALPRAGVKGSDLFVAPPDWGHPLRLQVKTSRNAKNHDKKGTYFCWFTSFKVIDNPDDSLWFCYVNLDGWPEKPGQVPEVYFVPSSDVINHMKTSYKPEDSSTFFWLYEDQGILQRGANGLSAMRDAMDAKKQSLASKDRGRWSGSESHTAPE